MFNIQNSLKYKNLLPKDGSAFLIPDFFSTQTAEQSFFELEKKVPWEHKPITLFGKTLMQPRLTCWFGDPGCSYSYSGTTHAPQSWIPELRVVKETVEKVTDTPFNSALANLYRNERDSMGLHSDDEKELGSNPIIASVSLGETRTIKFVHKKDPTCRLSLSLKPGSLLVMEGETQHYWKHGISKQKKMLRPRINITFRNVVTKRG